MKLTDEQIAELAPEWATHYKKVNVVKVLVFESIDRFQFYYKNGKFSRVHVKKCCACKGSKPLKPKPFDITQHEWSNKDIERVESWQDGRVAIHLNEFDLSYIRIEKKDAIAFAKHFGVTGEDLK